MKELEAERDGLVKQILELSSEKNTLNEALVEAHSAVLSKAGQLSTANDTIKDLKLNMVGLEGTLSEAQTWEGALPKSLAEEKQLRKHDAANHADSVKGDKIWTDHLADVATRRIRPPPAPPRAPPLPLHSPHFPFP